MPDGLADRSGKPLNRRKPLRRSPIRRTSPKAVRKAPTRKKPTRTALRNKADQLWSKLVRERDGACRRCTRRPPEVVLQAAHIVPRRYYAVRFDPRNGLALCLGCHKWQTEFPIAGRRFLIETIGWELFEELETLAEAPHDKPDYDAIIRELSNEGRWR